MGACGDEMKGSGKDLEKYLEHSVCMLCLLRPPYKTRMAMLCEVKKILNYVEMVAFKTGVVTIIMWFWRG